MKITHSSSNIFNELARVQKRHHRGAASSDRRAERERAHEEHAATVEWRKEDRKANRPKPEKPEKPEKPAKPPTPSPEPVTPDSEQDDDLRTLAERYVAQYEKESGTTLSEQDRLQKVQEVYDFYSEPSRQGRLEQIVF